MANAAAKRIAASNEKALQNLQLGLLGVNAATWILRFVFSVISSRPFIPRWLPFTLYILSTAGTVFIWRWFVTIGTPIRTGADVKVGDDLNGKGVIDLAWDVIYMTWICALGSALFGNKVWWLLISIPGFGLYKLFNLVRPLLGMFLPSLFGPKAPRDPNAAPGQQAGGGGAAAGADGQPIESRKQAKLRARMEKGDKRIQQVQMKR